MLADLQTFSLQLEFSHLAHLEAALEGQIGRKFEQGGEGLGTSGTSPLLSKILEHVHLGHAQISVMIIKASFM